MTEQTGPSGSETTAAAAAPDPAWRVMLDSAQPGGIIACLAAGARFFGIRPSMAAVYGDGAFAATAAQQAAIVKAGIHPGQLLRITVTGATGHHAARLGDIEQGDMSPGAGASWAHGEAAPHWRPALYSDRALKPAVISACSGLGLTLGTDYVLVVATLDGTFHDLDGSDLRTQRGVAGIQALGAGAAGFPVDVTLVTDPTFMPVPAAAVSPALTLALQIRSGFDAELASLIKLLGG